MILNKKHIGLGIAAAVAASGIAWFSTCAAESGHQESPAAPRAAHAEHDTLGEAEHAARGAADAKGTQAGHAEDDGHGDAPSGTTANLDPKEIEKKVCEHDIRQIDCNECRYELGVVKVDPSVTNALTRTAAVKEGELGTVLRLTGEVQYDQTTLVEVLPAGTGKVVSVKARLGQRVQEGELLAIIHSGDFGEAKAAYLEASAAAEVARQEKSRQLTISSALEKLLASASARPGSDIPAEILGEWKSKLVNAVARLRQAGIVLNRETALVAKQASSKAELETAQREMQTAQADYAALLEELQFNVKLDRLKNENASRLADARLSAAEQRMHLFGLDHEAIAAIPQMKDNGRFAQLEIRAPRAGLITAMSITEGKFVEASQSMCTIADTGNLWVWCDLYERDLGPLHERLASGDKPQASVKVTAFPQAFAGEVDLLDSAVNETTRTVKVRVQVRNEQGRLRPGMFAAVDIPLTEGKKISLVPRQAVLSDEGKMFAFVHWKDDLWMRRDVTVGLPQGDMVEVLAGLSTSDTVVTSGGFLFKSDILRAKMGAGCAD